MFLFLDIFLNADAALVIPFQSLWLRWHFRFIDFVHFCTKEKSKAISIIDYNPKNVELEWKIEITHSVYTSEMLFQIRPICQELSNLNLKYDKQFH